MIKWLAAAVCVLAAFSGRAQEENTFSTRGWWKPADPPFSPVVHGDASITFRFRAPEAREATLLFGEWDVDEVPMQRDETGVWSVTNSASTDWKPSIR